MPVSSRIPIAFVWSSSEFANNVGIIAIAMRNIGVIIIEIINDFLLTFSRNSHFAIIIDFDKFMNVSSLLLLRKYNSLSALPWKNFEVRLD